MSKFLLGDICSRLSSGKNITSDRVTSTGPYPVFGGNGLRGYTDNANFSGECAIIGRQGAFCGNVRYFSGEAYMTEHAVVVCADSNNCTRYIAYLLSTMSLGRLSGQSAQPGLSVKTLSGVQVDMPSLPEQKRIASILSILDEKIDMNQRTNDNLVQQARVLLAQWLTKHRGSYQLLPLSSVASINANTYTPKDDWEYVNYLDTSSITDDTIADIQYLVPTVDKLPSRARRIITASDVVYSIVRPIQHHFGLISDPLPNMLASTGFAVVRSTDSQVSNEVIYLSLTDEQFIERMQQLAEQSTSTFPSIKPSDLAVCQIPCPIDASLSDMLKSTFQLIAANRREIAALTVLGNTLLPKLMSGEIDVSAVQL